MMNNIDMPNYMSVPMEIEEPYDDFAHTQCTQSSFIYNTPKPKKHIYKDNTNKINSIYDKDLQENIPITSPDYKIISIFKTPCKIMKKNKKIGNIRNDINRKISDYFQLIPKESYSQTLVHNTYIKDEMKFELRSLEKEKQNPFKIGIKNFENNHLAKNKELEYPPDDFPYDLNKELLFKNNEIINIFEKKILSDIEDEEIL